MPHFGIMTIKARPYTLYSNILYKLRPNAVLRQCLNGPRVVRVLSKLHDVCQWFGPSSIMGRGPLWLVLSFESFMKWGFNFMGLIKLVARYIGSQYIVVATDHTTKWVEAKTLINNKQTTLLNFCMNTSLLGLVALPILLMIKVASSSMTSLRT